MFRCVKGGSEDRFAVDEQIYHQILLEITREGEGA
jgi:hypothetical protein